MSGTEIMVLRSTDTGAPTLSGTAGALIALLDACLVDGYNSQAIQGITRVGDVATVTFATAHGFAADGLTKVLQAGFDQAEYNGVFQVSNVTTTSYDITVTGTPVTPGTGSGTTKAAPLGWEKAFSGVNKGAYRSADGASTRLFLRVNDANPHNDSYRTAESRGYETMADVDTGTGLFPTAAQLANGIYNVKSTAADATARQWVLIGDGFEFYLFSAPYSPYSAHQIFYFGDPASEMASDPYGCAIFGSYATTSSSAETGTMAHHVLTSTGFTDQNGHFYARPYSQVGSSVGAGKLGNNVLGGQYLGAIALLPYPAPHNNGLYIAPVFTHDSSTLRGRLKGLYQTLHARPFGHLALVETSASPIGRRLLSISTPYSGSTPGEALMDIDGPWR